MQFGQTTQPKRDWSVGLCDCFSDCGEVNYYISYIL